MTSSEIDDQQKNLREHPALSLETFDDQENVAYSYHQNTTQSWRPPTPPPTPDRNIGRNERVESSKSSWFHSILPSNKKSSSSLLPRQAKFPPVKAFQSPTTLLSQNREDSMVDHSLLLQDESKLSQTDAVDSSGTKSNSSSFRHNYVIMNDQDHTIQYRSKRKKRSKRNYDQNIQKHADFFYKGIEELESQHQAQLQYASSCSNINKDGHNSSNVNNSGKSEYFVNPESKREFMEKLALLNSQNIMKDYDNAEDGFDDNPDFDDEGYDDGLDFTALFTFGCSPTSREKELSRRGLTLDHEGLPAISDIRKSSLSYISNGRIQIRLPKDRVRLLMDDCIEAGILCVEKEVVVPQKKSHGYNNISVNSNIGESDEQLMLEANHSDEKITSPLLQPKINDGIQQEMNQNFSSDDVNNDSCNNDISQSNLPELNYVLTVDKDLYKRVLSEVADSRTPCGLYYCCHAFESKSVNINVAIGILAFVFALLLWGTLVWPTS